ncbi:hypothetical protein N7504_010649 [Penicillium tannophilum]|nr:hypothetical protein N7504_010649 [Penicillium tannophilum]
MPESPPKYYDLPEILPGYRCAWDYFNSLHLESGLKDQLGTLNFLTNDRKAQAARETILKGQSISLE